MIPGNDQGVVRAVRHNVRVARALGGVLAVASGIALVRLALGGAFPGPAVYARFAWYLFYPVTALRSLNDQTVLILLYGLVWLYIMLIQTVVHRRPFGPALGQTVLWMVLVALPFVPFGVKYVSLARFTPGVASYLLRFAPFIGLLVVLFLANRIFFQLTPLAAGAWACVNFLLAVVVVTLSDLLPMIKSGLLFQALDYRISLISTLISRTPVLAMLAAMVLAGFYVSVLERHLLRVPRDVGRLSAVSVPAFMALAVALVIVIMRDDYRRYRYFNYRGGIATVFFAPYDDRQLITFDDNRFAITNGRQNVFYPFGRFDAGDTLRHHAARIRRMKIIEGLDYYRLGRIMFVLAYGPRDTVVYQTLRPVISGRGYRIPDQVRVWAEMIDRRYGSDAAEITVFGWMHVNGSPPVGTEFIVNRIEWDPETGRKHASPVWQDVIAADGGFDFSCAGGADTDTGYFRLDFSVPDSVFGSNLRTIKVRSPLPVFRRPGQYRLDTFDIVFAREGAPSFRKTLAVATSARTDSFLISLPELVAVMPLRISGAVSATGQMVDVALECLTWKLDGQSRSRFMEQLDPSRFYLREPDGNVSISIY